MDEIEAGAMAPEAAMAADSETYSSVETSYETGPLNWEGEWDRSDMI